jgi:putative membrane protein
MGIYLRGLAMGAADAVPGVSGGTIALITGIYDRLIAAVTTATSGRLVDLMAIFRGDRDRTVAALREMDAPFLMVLLAGILTAVVTLSRLVHLAITTAPATTYAFFVGLIAASAIVLWRELRIDGRRAVAALVGALMAAAVGGNATAAIGTGPLATVTAGAIAVSAMVLPGISGSLLLLLLGQYERMVATLSAGVDALLALATGGPLAALVDPWTTITLFVGGALLGLTTVAHAVRWALDRARRDTMAFLIGLIVGALRVPLAEVVAGVPGTAGGIALWIGGPIIIGVGLVLWIDHLGTLSEPA